MYTLWTISECFARYTSKYIFKVKVFYFKDQHCKLMVCAYTVYIYTNMYAQGRVSVYVYRIILWILFCTFYISSTFSTSFSANNDLNVLPKRKVTKLFINTIFIEQIWSNVYCCCFIIFIKNKFIVESYIHHWLYFFISPQANDLVNRTKDVI